MLSDERLATALDCEGYFGVNRMKHKSGSIQHSAKIGLAMIHPFYATCLFERFGGSLRPMRNRKGKHRLVRWEMVGNLQIPAVLAALRGLLEVKHEQAQNLTDFLRVYKSMRKPNSRHPRTPNEALILDAFWIKAKALNKSAPATTKRENPVTGCDSLNSQEIVRESSEAETPVLDGDFLSAIGIKNE
jgi:hypothetical protein